MEPIFAGATDRSILVFVPDPASTDGSGKTGLAHTDLTVSYSRVETDNDVTVTDVTSSLSALTNLTDAHSDWGWKEVSDTLAPGLYRLDLADAVLASGAWYAVVYVMVTTSAAAATPKAFALTDYDPAALGARLPSASAKGNLDTVFDTDFAANYNATEDAWKADLTYVLGTEVESGTSFTTLYHADICFTRDQSNTQDEWTVTWFKNGVRQTSGITGPTVQVVKRVDGTDLVGAAAMTQIGSTGSYKYDEATDRVTPGEAVLAVASATIDGGTRTFSRLISRDT
jgi:hypothetical protein